MKKYTWPLEWSTTDRPCLTCGVAVHTATNADKPGQNRHESVAGSIASAAERQPSPVNWAEYTGLGDALLKRVLDEA
jgi:hypothetical protein